MVSRRVSRQEHPIEKVYELEGTQLSPVLGSCWEGSLDGMDVGDLAEVEERFPW